ncbi:hypothetical protein K504DRAFT_467789 [Pleomassaria siparia CBS 279.74]|uniref:Uncharacterized protein n=1 Tax=Pleomassaria siparia CBS 279.74 TaxID=1314801 RepID=A0A6G1JP68_9PLEO|nr:hypothetical protein K504DRAFT_467789 [Pleomassaria siparia CBS 279.74]
MRMRLPCTSPLQFSSPTPAFTAAALSLFAGVNACPLILLTHLKLSQSTHVTVQHASYQPPLKMPASSHVNRE